MGLLKKCLRILDKKEEMQDSTKKPSSLFFDLCKTYSFSHAGFLKVEGDMYVMQHSFSLSSRTIYQCISTKTFWKGTLPEANSWYVFKGDEMKDFFQLFDTNIIHSMKTLAIIRLANVLQEGIFFAYSQDESDINLPKDIADFCGDLFSLKYVSPLCEQEVEQIQEQAQAQGKDFQFALISVDSAIENSIQEFEMLDEVIQKRLFQVIFEEIYRIVEDGLGSNNIVNFDEQKEIKVAINVPQEIDSDLFLMHLQNACQKVIGKFAVQFISYLNAGLCRNGKGIKNFIL